MQASAPHQRTGFVICETPDTFPPFFTRLLINHTDLILLAVAVLDIAPIGFTAVAPIVGFHLGHRLERYYEQRAHAYLEVRSLRTDQAVFIVFCRVCDLLPK